MQYDIRTSEQDTDNQKRLRPLRLKRKRKKGAQQSYQLDEDFDLYKAEGEEGKKRVFVFEKRQLFNDFEPEPGVTMTQGNQTKTGESKFSRAQTNILDSVQDSEELSRTLRRLTKDQYEEIVTRGPLSRHHGKS